MRNEEILHTVKETRNILHAIKERMLTGLVTSCVGTALYNTLLNKKYKGREEVEEDVSSYLIALRKREDTGI